MFAPRLALLKSTLFAMQSLEATHPSNDERWRRRQLPGLAQTEHRQWIWYARSHGLGERGDGE